MMPSADTAPITILVVDDHHVVRVGLCAVLAANPALRIVGDASNAIEAIARCTQLRPAVVLLDIRMPGGSGIEACRWIKQQLPRIKVLFLTSYSDAETLADALRAGADGYTLKTLHGDDIAASVLKVARGEAVTDPAIARTLMSLAATATPAESSATGRDAAGLNTLTDRERRILERVHAGLTNKEIANELRLSEKTIRNLLSVVFQKLGVTTRTMAAAHWAGTESSSSVVRRTRPQR